MSSASTSSSYRHRVPVTTFASDGESISDDSSIEDMDGEASPQLQPSSSADTSNDRTAVLSTKSQATKRPHSGESFADEPACASMQALDRPANNDWSIPKSTGLDSIRDTTQHQARYQAPSSTKTRTDSLGSDGSGGVPSRVDLSQKDRLINQSASHSSMPSNPVLPNAPTNLLPKTFFTYRAQLTFGLKPTTAGVNVPTLFKHWIHSSSETLPDFSLLPYEDENGQQITSQDQAPDDNPEFYMKFFFNHRVLQHGNLTGMVLFQCTLPWSQLKKSNSTYFNWLRFNNVYLNQTKFKTATLVPCGFLVGAHPGHFRRDEAEAELQSSLNLTGPDMQFQLSARTASVPLKHGSSERYTFQAVVVETSTTFAKQLREAFYGLQKPSLAKLQYPYTGAYQFVPFLQSKEWTAQKILQLAKVHVAIIKEL
jgi:hypothetical protein